MKLSIKKYLMKMFTPSKKLLDMTVNSLSRSNERKNQILIEEFDHGSD